MKQRPLKLSIFPSIGLLVAVLLFLNLFYMVFCLHRSDFAGAQSLLAQKILLCAVRPPRVEEIKRSYTFANKSEKCGACESGALPEIDLLLKGGVFAGKFLPRIESVEVVELLQSMRTHWCDIMQSPLPGTSGLPLFCSQARVLNDALMHRSMELKNRLWSPAWSALLLVLMFLVWLSLWRYFIYRKRSARANYQDDSLVALENQLLLALPVAFVLLDHSLAIKFVNYSGESYFGKLPLSDIVNFAEFCQDQVLLEHLRDTFLSARPVPYEKLSSESENVLLNSISGRERQVVIQWYRLYLGGRDYLLGVIHDLQEKGALDISQEQLLELSQKLFRVQDDERQHLADELHDGLCQSLAALKMQVFRVEKGIEEEKNRDDCRKARQFIAQIIEDVRRLSHDLSPVILDDLGLGGALAHLVNNFAALNDLKVSISVPDLEGCFASDASRHVYRIVQEAVNNVAKHAQASFLVLEAEVTDETVRFMVQDDGVGFDSNHVGGSTRNAAGLGLTSMAQRVTLLGGEFSISTKLGEGCLVKFVLPRKSELANY